MKKTVLAALFVLVSFSFGSCSKKDELGRKAAAEFCECFKSKTETTCLKELEAKYKKADYLNDDFIKAFNEAQTCGATLKKEYSTKGSAQYVIEIAD